MREFSDDKEPPMDRQPAAQPRFGRLLLVLMLAVLLIVGITFLSEAYLS
jgi:hypothetical protein